MRTVLIALSLIMSSFAYAGQLVENEGYVQMAKYGTYRGSYLFAKTLKEVQKGINSSGVLPKDVELLELCDWEGEFKTKDANSVIRLLNIASLDKSPIKITYYDN